MRSVIVAGVMCGGMLAWAAPAQAPGFAALRSLEHGQWQLREVGGPARTVCLGDPVTLFQQRHRGAQCSRRVIENTPNTATVSYSCPGAGQGRTTITVDTPRSIHIASQGLEGGLPFDFEVDGRRTGICGPHLPGS